MANKQKRPNRSAVNNITINNYVVINNPPADKGRLDLALEIANIASYSLNSILAIAQLWALNRQ